jgi:hypothetical protein
MPCPKGRFALHLEKQTMNIVNIRFNGNSTFSYMTDEQIEHAVKNGWEKSDFVVDAKCCGIVLSKHN